MPASPPPKSRRPRQPAGNAADGERSTPIPEFDVEAFARDADARQGAGPVRDGEILEQAHRLHLDGRSEPALSLLAHLLTRERPHPVAARLSAECCTALERECLLAIGSESTMLISAISTEEVKRFSLDHVSGFLLSLLDGETPIETILDISGMPRLVVLRHLRDLLDRGIVGVASGLRSR
jgi:hypothetical protein